MCACPLRPILESTQSLRIFGIFSAGEEKRRSENERTWRYVERYARACLTIFDSTFPSSACYGGNVNEYLHMHVAIHYEDVTRSSSTSVATVVYTVQYIETLLYRTYNNQPAESLSGACSVQSCEKSCN